MRIIDAACPHCNVHHKAEVLEVVDLLARPELAEGLRSGQHLRVTCPNGHAGAVDVPLLIRRAEVGVLFVPSNATKPEENETALRRMLAALPAEVLSGLADDEGRIGVERNPLLPVALAEEPEIRALAGPLLALLGAAGSPEALSAAVAEHPELRGAPAQEALRRLAAAEPDTEEGRAWAAFLHQLAGLLQAGDAAGALPDAIAGPLAKWERFQSVGTAGDLAALDGAIAGFEAALQDPALQEHHVALHAELSNALAVRYVHTSRPADLDAAIAHAEAAVRLAPEGHAQKSALLGIILSAHLVRRFRLTGARADLDAAIAHAEAAVRLAPEGHAQKSALIGTLAIHLSERFALTGARADLDAAIAHAEAAVRLTPERAGDRPAWLGTLSNHLWRRFRLTGARADLDVAIAHAEAAVRLTPEGASDRPGWLNNLANRLSERFRLTGARADLDAAIAHAEEAVRLTTEGHGDKFMYLHNLSNHLAERFRLTRARADLDAAIAHVGAAVRLTPEGHGDRPGLLTSHANRLSERFRLTGARADLDAAIAYAEAAVRLTPEGHGDMSIYLYNLALRLSERFRLTRARLDLDAAIAHAEAAVRLGPEGRVQKPTLLDTLANRLSERFALTEARADLDAAIAYAEAAVVGWQRLALESEDARTIAAQSAAVARRLLGLLIQAGEPARFVAALEAAKAVRLRVDLVGSGRAPANLDGAGQLRYQDVRGELRRLSGELRAMDALPATARAPTYAADVARFRAREGELRTERTRLEAGDPAFSAPPLDYASVRSQAGEAGEAIVYLQPLDAAPDRLLVLIVHPASPPGGPAPEDVLEIAGLGRGAVHELLLAQADTFFEALRTSNAFAPADGVPLGWLTADWATKHDSRNADARRRWLDTMAGAVTRLGRDLMTPVARRLTALGNGRVVLIPGEGLGLFPLHAGPVDADGTVFGETFETRYAPSATALGYTPRPVRRSHQSRGLIGIANPDGSLAFSDFEMRRVAQLFHPASSIRHGRTARRDWLLGEARTGDILALSTHAMFAMGRPELSYFVLAHPQGLQVAPHSARRQRDAVQAECEKLFLDDILRGELRLTPGTLVVADACETGQIVPGDSAEEFMGFPAAFLASGASAVIASLWSVADFSTALLMEEMYRRIKAGEPPASALQKAAQWLRQLPSSELRPRLQAELACAQQEKQELRARRKSLAVAEKAADDSYDEAVRTVEALHDALASLEHAPEHPFAHPFYWAPFALHGNSHAAPAPASVNQGDGIGLAIPTRGPSIAARLARIFGLSQRRD